MSKKGCTTKYLKIALDIANRIYNEEFRVGDKIRGRSVLSGQYNVSPETIRRAMILLKDMGAVEIFEKSGVFVSSKENAYKFIEKFGLHENILITKSNIQKLVNQKNLIEKEIKENIDLIVENAIQLKSTGLIYPLEIQITKESRMNGLSETDAGFWDNTKATIVGVRRDGNVFVSPGPYFKFKEKDIILFIGEKGSFNIVKEFITGNQS